MTPDTSSFFKMNPAPIKAPKMISGVTSLARTSGKVRLDCPECGVQFERYACWVKRKKICYCGKACSDDAKRRPVECSCVVCGSSFINTPAEVGRVVTCSKKCANEKKSQLVTNGDVLSKGSFVKATNTREKGYGKLSPSDVKEIISYDGPRRDMADKHSIHIETVSLLRRQNGVPSRQGKRT